MSDFFVPFEMWRCILCGAMIDQVMYRNRLASKERGVDMPKFVSEEHRRTWIEAVRRTKTLKKQLSVAGMPGTVVAPRPAPRTRETAVAETVELGGALLAIDAMLARLDRDRAAFERAKDILRHAGAGHAPGAQG
jgi:hypothetical protein